MHIHVMTHFDCVKLLFVFATLLIRIASNAEDLALAQIR